MINEMRIHTVQKNYKAIAQGKIKDDRIIKLVLNSNYEVEKAVVEVNENAKKTVEILKEIDEDLGERGIMTRVDFCYDLEKEIKTNENLFKMFLSCYMLSLNKKLNVVSSKASKENINENLNIKINLENYELTIYNCQDKRDAKTRIEYRSKKIRRQADDKTKIIDELEKYENELKKIIKNIDDLFKRVEEIETKKIIKEYKTTREKYVSFSEFVTVKDEQGELITKNILCELMKSAEMKTKISNFIREFKRKRKNRLNFVNKTQIKNLCEKLKKAIYKTLTE